MAGAEQFVSEVAVTMLDVDELESHVVGESRSSHEILDEAIELVIFKNVRNAVEAAIEQRMGVSGLRLQTVLRVRTREAAGVRELQADEQVALGAGSEALAMCG